MKKKIIATISCALAVFAFTGCGQTASIAFNGSYWNKDTSNETPAGKEEIIEYGVYSVEENELWNKTQTNAVLIRSCGKTFHRILTILIKQPAQFRAAVWL